MRAFRTISVKDPELARVQDNIDQVLTPLIRLPILEGQLIQNVSLKSAKTNDVPHQLQRKLSGWILCSQDSGGHVWDLQASNRIPERTLQLKCSADMIVSLWVF